jgi:hypothetical protein
VTPLEAIAADIFLDWLGTERGEQYLLDGDSELAGIGPSGRVSLTVTPLYPAEDDPAWTRRCTAVAAQLKERGSPPVALWVPPDTDLPHGDRSDFVSRIAEAAEKLQPGDRGQVEFPVSLTLKKTGSDASYVHVVGGLAPHWAKLTGRAYGQYVLDTTPIHRLPEPESRIADLLEWVALLGNGMKPGASSEIQAEDAWTLSRPRRTQEFTVIGAPPRSDPTNGTAVRRHLRAALKSASSAPADGPRALLAVGIVRGTEEEAATIALRSSDPSLYSGFDTICLIADGRCKPLFRR